jgi:erythromycin esterase-like protein
VGVLQGIDAAAGDDVWAVGSYQKSGSTKTLIEHWNGSIWTVVSSPNGGGNTTLLGVASSGPTNSFAAGYIGIQSKARTFAAHCAC